MVLIDCLDNHFVLKSNNKSFKKKCSNIFVSLYGDYCDDDDYDGE